jgi:hypothetical protein
MRSESQAQSSEKASRVEADEAPRSRQGLATEWGETRQSSVRHERFEREDSPFYTTTIHYNDRRGVAAMKREEGSTGVNPRDMNSAIDVHVVDDGGSMYPMTFAGIGNAFVLGRMGERYSIVVRNRTDDRVEAVTSIDGLDALDGRPATLSKRGYIIDPRGSVTIDGFRQSDRTVAAFRFGKVSESYAASKGDTRDVGVIGVAVFGDRDNPVREEARRRLDASPFRSDPRYAQPPR